MITTSRYFRLTLAIGAATAVLGFTPINYDSPTAAGSTIWRSSEHDSLVARLLAALGTRETWAGAVVDHISAVVEPPGGESFMIELWTRWDTPGTISWVRMRTREQLRIWDATRGWTVNRNRGEDATIREWTPDRLAAERASYRTQAERAFHRIAMRDPSLSYGVVSGAHTGWLDVRDKDGTVVLIELTADGSPARVQRADEGSPIHFGSLVSFGNHKQPGAGQAGSGERFTTYVAELLPSAEGIRWGLPTNLRDLNPAR